MNRKKIEVLKDIEKEAGKKIAHLKKVKNIKERKGLNVHYDWKQLLLLLTFFVVMYIIGSFAAWQFDPSKWLVIELPIIRGIGAFFLILVVILPFVKNPRIK